MLQRLSLLLLLLCSAIVAPGILTVYNIKGLGIHKYPIGNGDGFVKVFSDDHLIGTTEVKNNTVNPVWKEKFLYRNASIGSRLNLFMYDKDGEFDDHLGTCGTNIKTGSYKHTCNLFTGGQMIFRYSLQQRRGGAAGR